VRAWDAITWQMDSLRRRHHSLVASVRFALLDDYQLVAIGNGERFILLTIIKNF
jgi:hypothetical protein